MILNRNLILIHFYSARQFKVTFLVCKRCNSGLFFCILLVFIDLRYLQELLQTKRLYTTSYIGVIKSCQNLLEWSHSIKRCSMNSLSLLQNVHRNEGRRPIIFVVNLFVAKYLCNTLNWNSRDLESTVTLKGIQYTIVLVFLIPLQLIGFCNLCNAHLIILIENARYKY